jgi:hypothetical protein
MMRAMTNRGLAPMPVRVMLGDLVGREVDVSPGDRVTGTACVAVYVNDRTQLASLALLDLPLAAYLGGALALLPAGGVADMVEDKDLSTLVLENVHEIVNVLAGIFNAEGERHVKLFRVYPPGEPLPQDVRDAAATYGDRLDLEVRVGGYGKGALSLVVTG